MAAMEWDELTQIGRAVRRILTSPRRMVDLIALVGDDAAKVVRSAREGSRADGITGALAVGLAKKLIEHYGQEAPQLPPIEPDDYSD